MSCVKHADRPAAGYCQKCGFGLCEDCGVEVGGRVYCKGCVEDVVNGNYEGEPRRYVAGRSRAVFFITSLLPGASAMYLGLIKRGLFFMTAFFLTIYFASSWGMGFLGLMIPVLWVTAFFDGFNKLKRMESGILVEDGIEDILDFARRNKSILCLFLAILLLNWALGSGLKFIASILPGRLYWMFYEANKLLPLLLIIGGIVFLLKRKREREK